MKNWLSKNVFHKVFFSGVVTALLFVVVIARHENLNASPRIIDITSDPVTIDSILRHRALLRLFIDSVSSQGWSFMQFGEGGQMKISEDALPEQQFELGLMHVTGNLTYGIRSSVAKAKKHEFSDGGIGFSQQHDVSELTQLMIGPSIGYSYISTVKPYFMTFTAEPSYGYFTSKHTSTLRDSVLTNSTTYRDGLCLLLDFTALEMISKRFGAGGGFYAQFAPFREPVIGFTALLTYGLFDWVKED